MHASNCANASADNGKEEESCFRNAETALDSTSLINAHNCKTDDVNYY